MAEDEYRSFEMVEPKKHTHKKKTLQFPDPYLYLRSLSEESFSLSEEMMAPNCWLKERRASSNTSSLATPGQAQGAPCEL